MTEDCARSILRLIAVVTVMYGLSMVVYTIIAFLGTTTAIGKATSVL